jgi:beta-glucanase (GH16 family)
MNDLDLRKAAEQWVEKYHIFDIEWREELIEQYVDLLANRQSNQPRIYLIVSNVPVNH